MENVHSAPVADGLGGAINITMAISQATIAVHISPSAGEFTNESKPFLLPVLQFLERTGAPLLANLYPYFVYTYKAAGDLDVSFMLFTAPGTVVQDGEYGYQNMFDASVDAVHAAVERLGEQERLGLVSELAGRRRHVHGDGGLRYRRRDIDGAAQAGRRKRAVDVLHGRSHVPRVTPGDLVADDEVLE